MTSPTNGGRSVDIVRSRTQTMEFVCFCFYYYYYYYVRAIAQVVSRWLPTVASRVRSSGICGRQSNTGAGFLRVLRFSLPIIPPTAPHSSSIIWRRFNRPKSGRCTQWTVSHVQDIIKNFFFFCTIYKSSISPGVSKQITRVSLILWTTVTGQLVLLKHLSTDYTENTALRLVRNFLHTLPLARTAQKTQFLSTLNKYNNPSFATVI
jgi:hypothetical protein